MSNKLDELVGSASVWVNKFLDNRNECDYEFADSFYFVNKKLIGT